MSVREILHNACSCYHKGCEKVCDVCDDSLSEIHKAVKGCVPKEKTTPLAGSVANGEIQTNDQQLYDDYIYNQARKETLAAIDKLFEED